MSRANTKAWKRLPLAERKAIEAHEKLLRELPCMATGRQHEITLHHAAGGSMKDIGIHSGTGQRASDWLQIPITHDAHVGVTGIDSGFGVRAWEELYGSQVAMLHRVSALVGYDVFNKAGVGNGRV